MKPSSKRLSSTLVFIFLLFNFGHIFSAAASSDSAKGINPLFWQLEFNGVKSHALGSIHLGEPSMYPLPETIMTAFNASQTLAVEVNLDNASQELMSQLSRRYGVDMSRSLASELSLPTIKMYAEYCKAKGLPCKQFERFKPWLVSVTFASMSFMESGYDPGLGIDKFFIEQAQGKKALVELETAQSQFKLFADLPLPLQEELLVQSMTTEVSELRELITAWSKGDELRLVNLFEDVENAELKQVFKQKMLINRNYKMADNILKQLKKGKQLFVVVGTAHLIGEQNVLAILQKNGVKVSRR